MEGDDAFGVAATPRDSRQGRKGEEVADGRERERVGFEAGAGSLRARGKVDRPKCDGTVGVLVVVEQMCVLK